MAAPMKKNVYKINKDRFNTDSAKISEKQVTNVAAEADSFFSTPVSTQHTIEYQQQQQQQVAVAAAAAINRQRSFHEIVSSFQGSFHFLQESTIEVEAKREREQEREFCNQTSSMESKVGDIGVSESDSALNLGTIGHTELLNTDSNHITRRDNTVVTMSFKCVVCQDLIEWDGEPIYRCDQCEEWFHKESCVGNKSPFSCKNCNASQMHPPSEDALPGHKLTEDGQSALKHTVLLNTDDHTSTVGGISESHSKNTDHSLILKNLSKKAECTTKRESSITAPTRSNIASPKQGGFDDCDVLLVTLAEEEMAPLQDQKLDVVLDDARQPGSVAGLPDPDIVLQLPSKQGMQLSSDNPETLNRRKQDAQSYLKSRMDCPVSVKNEQEISPATTKIGPHQFQRSPIHEIPTHMVKKLHSITQNTSDHRFVVLNVQKEKGYVETVHVHGQILKYKKNPLKYTKNPLKTNPPIKLDMRQQCRNIAVKINTNEILSGEILTEIHVNAAQQLIKSRFNIMGFQNTKLSPFFSEKENIWIMGPTFENQGIPCGQIHFDGDNHWVFSGSHKPGVVYVFDSLTNADINDNVIMQISQIYNHEIIKIIIPRIQQQSNESNDCGLFAIANAVEFCITNLPESNFNITFDISKMRPHLVSCLKKEKMEPFPKK